MKPADFTVRLVSQCPHKEQSQIWRAAMIVTGMEGCKVEEIIRALTAFEQTRDVGTQEPARWLTHFAGLESEASGKALRPWLEITYNGQSISDKGSFRRLLAERAKTAA